MIAPYRKQLIITAICGALAFGSSGAGASVVKDNFKKRVKKVVLDNGLRLVMMQKKNAPVVALYIKFKVGSVDETPDIAGTAHLLEHMLFKGSKQIGTTDYEGEKKYLKVLEAWNERLSVMRREARVLLDDDPKKKELEQKMKQLSARIAKMHKLHSKFVIKEHDALIYNSHGQAGFNAYTSKDVTNYQINLPANKLEIWARLESDRLKNPILREYYTERDVVIEERRMRYESIGFRKLREKYIATAFESHAYRRPIIGYMSNIRHLTKADTEAFFKRYYAPNNMVIGMVGDLEFAETEKLIKKYFGGLKPSKLPPPAKVLDPPQTGERRVSVEFASGRSLMIGWHKPTLPHPDNMAFELMSSILTSGRNSILTKKLVYEKAVALRVSSWNGDPGERYNNMLSLFVTPLGTVDYGKIETMIYEELDKIKAGQLNEELLEIHKKKMVTDFYRQLESNGGLADSLTYYELIYGDWSFLFDFYDKLQAISKEDIVRVAKKYLNKNNRTVGTLIKTEKAQN